VKRPGCADRDHVVTNLTPIPVSSQVDHGKDVHLGAVEQVGGEEIQRQDPLRLGPQEFSPARSVPARRRIDPCALEDLLNRRRRYRDAQPGKLGADHREYGDIPTTSLSRASRNTTDGPCGAPAAVRAPLARPAHLPAAHDGAVRPQECSRSNDQPHRREAPGRQRPGKRGRPRPVRPRQPRIDLWPLTLRNSELMAQHQDLGVLPPRLAARQPEQRHDTGHDQEDQAQAHKPKIIPPPDGPRPAQPTPGGLTKPTAFRKVSAQVAQVFGTHGIPRQLRPAPR
jgi:hypothetical protein